MEWFWWGAQHLHGNVQGKKDLVSEGQNSGKDLVDAGTPGKDPGDRNEDYDRIRTLRFAFPHSYSHLPD
ncbi:hypothetical protein QOT17_019970 [Balamuthia mandrillaris]